MRQYFILKNNKNVGPMPPERLIQYGLEPGSLVWTDGMPEWMPANQVPELAQYLSAPAPPMGQQHYQQPSYQQPYQQSYQHKPDPYQNGPSSQIPQPVANISSQGIFKVLLYLILIYTFIAGLIEFIKSFDCFGKGHQAWPGLFILFGAMMVMAITVVIVIRMAKKDKYGFLSFAFFILTFIFALLDMILIKTNYVFILMLVAGILGFICTLFAVMPLDKLGDTQSFNNILAEAKSIDFVLLGIYTAFSVALIIYAAVNKSGIKAFN